MLPIPILCMPHGPFGARSLKKMGVCLDTTNPTVLLSRTMAGAKWHYASGLHQGQWRISPNMLYFKTLCIRSNCAVTAQQYFSQCNSAPSYLCTLTYHSHVSVFWEITSICYISAVTLEGTYKRVPAMCTSIPIFPLSPKDGMREIAVNPETRAIRTAS